MPVIALVVIAVFTIYVLKPEERLAVLRPVLRFIAGPAASAARRATWNEDGFVEALRERTPYPLVVLAIAMLNAVVFMMMALAPGALGDPETLVAWGGNFGPRTTNLEWGRLLVSLFVHAGPLHLLVTVAALVQAGLLVERLVGNVAFAAIYFLAGFFASAVSLWLHPVDVSVGATGAVFGLYGFIGAVAMSGVVTSGVRVPLRTIGALVPVGGLFVAYNVADQSLSFNAELAGCAAGFVTGLMLMHDLAVRRPAAPRVAAAVAATFVVAGALAVPLYGLVDVRPEIRRVVTLEDGGAARYEAAVGRFKRGRISAKDLARVIERTIVPELQMARIRLAAPGRIPHEHELLVERARTFLRLREESWQLRAEALEAGNSARLRNADAIEAASLQVLAAISPSVRQ